MDDSELVLVLVPDSPSSSCSIAGSNSGNDATDMPSEAEEGKQLLERIVSMLWRTIESQQSHPDHGTKISTSTMTMASPSPSPSTRVSGHRLS